MADREIVLDTETTGLDPFTGDRLVEIGCVELYNSIPTGESFHKYINPQRDMPAEAFRIHGLSREFLTGQPLFSDIAQDFIDFIGDARLVIHNAEFDMKFINHEMSLLGLAPIGMNRVIDTLTLARRKHPGSPNSLDALCARYKIDNTRRTKHGALLDSEILAEVYLELTGGRQSALMLATAPQKMTVAQPTKIVTPRQTPLESILSDAEAQAHAESIDAMGDKALWNTYR